MTKRKYGIDLLRILSMLFIVILHLLKQGGLLDATEINSPNYHFAWIMEIIAMCAVNCYGLISGYVNVDHKPKYHKLGVMWLQVVFYGFFIAVIYSFILGDEFRPEFWTNPFFPVCTVQYWYFTAYFVLFLFMPYLNIMINHLSKPQLKALGITIFIVFSVASTIWQGDMFITKNGYSFLWLTLLYLLGAVIKKIDFAEKLRCRWWLLIFAAAVAVTCIFKLADHETGAVADENLLTYYPSPTTVIQAVSLLAIGVRMNIKNKKAIRLIKFFAPLSFSVYLIHTNPFIFYYLIKNCTAEIAGFATPLMVLSILGIAIAIFLACTLIDSLRAMLFKAIKITPALAKAEDKIRKKSEKKQ